MNYFESDNSIFLVAEINNEIIFTAVISVGKNKAISHVGVLGINLKKEWRGKGIGSQLLTKIIDWAKDSGVLKRVELFVFASNQPAITLYEKFGFTTEGRRSMAV